MPQTTFAIDFTHESMTAAFVSDDGVPEGTAGFDLIDFLAGDSGGLDKFVALLIAKSRTAKDGIKTVVLSMPCDLDASRSRVVNFPQASWLNDQPLPELLASALNVPVVMERRAIINLCYDRVMLGLPDDCLAVGCYVDTHYESAIWHRGALLRGKNGSAGNIAHITIQDREDNCFCGKVGCVDLYGAGLRMRQLHTMIFPDTPLESLFERHGEHPIVLDYLGMMAYPIAMELNIVDPDFLILGGAIPSMRGFPRTLLEEEIVRHSYHPNPDQAGAIFLPSVASTTPGVICAAQYALTSC
ncbi:MAG: ROK family protein [Planctomycetaceae bacterium]|nr:ROK family protein [Planctomycetaceae bacterium]